MDAGHLRGIARAARDRPGASALVALDPDGARRRWSWEELAREVDRSTGWLASAGLEPGQRVALVLPRRPEAVVLLHAVLRMGAVAAPLSTRWTARETREALSGLKPRLVVSARGIPLPGTGEGPGPPVLRIEDRPSDSDSVAGLPEAPAGGPAAVLWTSGTSGARRGVELGREGLELHADLVRRRLGLTPRDRWLASLSMAHVGGLSLVLRAAEVGSTLLVPDEGETGGFDGERLEARIRGGDVTHLSLVPTMLRRLLDAAADHPAPPSLRCVLLGGAPAPRPLLDRALELGWPVALTWGMTEASSQVATAPPALVRRKPGTVGPPLDGLEVRMEDGSGGNAGEILVRGPTLGRTDRGEALGDEAGWYHTGDAGRVDEEGDLWITGRLSRRIVTGGVTVDPGEVEDVLRSHPGVRDAVVLGVPDPEWGERVVAGVVLSAVGGEAPDPGELLDAYLRERLSPAKRPRTLRRLEALPRNAAGKVDVEAVARLFGR